MLHQTNDQSATTSAWPFCEICCFYIHGKKVTLSDDVISSLHLQIPGGSPNTTNDQRRIPPNTDKLYITGGFTVLPNGSDGTTVPDSPHMFIEFLNPLNTKGWHFWQTLAKIISALWLFAHECPIPRHRRGPPNYQHVGPRGTPLNAQSIQQITADLPEVSLHRFAWNHSILQVAASKHPKLTKTVPWILPWGLANDWMIGNHLESPLTQWWKFMWTLFLDFGQLNGKALDRMLTWSRNLQFFDISNSQHKPTSGINQIQQNIKSSIIVHEHPT